MKVRRERAEQRGCGAAALEEVTASGPCEGEGELRYCFGMPCSDDGHGQQPRICVHALEDEGERTAERMIYRSRTR
jgi:hypothetical protein